MLLKEVFYMFAYCLHIVIFRTDCVIYELKYEKTIKFVIIYS